MNPLNSVTHITAGNYSSQWDNIPDNEPEKQCRARQLDSTHNTTPRCLWKPTILRTNQPKLQKQSSKNTRDKHKEPAMFSHRNAKELGSHHKNVVYKKQSRKVTQISWLSEDDQTNLHTGVPKPTQFIDTEHKLTSSLQRHNQQEKQTKQPSNTPVSKKNQISQRTTTSHTGKNHHKQSGAAGNSSQKKKDGKLNHTRARQNRTQTSWEFVDDTAHAEEPLRS